MEVEAHLAGCETCRSQAEFETGLRQRLRALPPVAVAGDLEARVVQRLRQHRARVGTWTRLVLPVAAVLVLAVLWGRNAAPVVAWELVEDHNHCRLLESLALPAGDAASSPVEPQLRDLPRDVRGLSLVGASRCALRDGTVVLHLQYVAEDGERRVSLFVVDHTVHFGSAYASRMGGSDVRLVRAGGRIIGLVGDDAADLDAFTDAVSA